MLKLGHLTADPEYSRHSVTILRTMHQVMSKYPTAVGYLLCALDFYLSEPKEIAIIGDAASHEARLFVEETYSRYLPNKVLAASKPGDEEATGAISLLSNREMVDGKVTAYVCRNYTCLQPATTVEEFIERLNQ